MSQLLGRAPCLEALAVSSDFAQGASASFFFASISLETALSGNEDHPGFVKLNRPGRTVILESGSCFFLDDRKRNARLEFETTETCLKEYTPELPRSIRSAWSVKRDLFGGTEFLECTGCFLRQLRANVRAGHGTNKTAKTLAGWKARAWSLLVS